MLYNTHLATFIKVVEYGSFRRAAEQVGISPSAVLKQISLLEQALGFTLFDRSRKGVTLTEAGASIYRDAKYILQYCETAEERARELDTKQTNWIRIGVSAMNSVQSLIALWPGIQKQLPDLKCRFTTFDCAKDGMERSLLTLGQDSDILLGVFDEQFLSAFHLKALKLMDVPATIAEVFDPAAGRDPLPALKMEDLQGRTVLLPRQGLFEAADAFRLKVQMEYPQIHIEDFDMYSLDLFYRCQSKGYCVFTYDVWKMGHMLLRQRRVDWPFGSCYGILYPENSSEKTLKFIDAVCIALQSEA